MVESVVRWVNNISQGKEDTHQMMTKAEFVEGESIGPVARNVE